MKMKTYRNANGGIEMISEENAFAEVKEMGHTFAVAMAERGHKTQDSDLMNGLAAYTILNLAGENARFDAAYKMVVDAIAREMFERAKRAA
jgi:hypothetical protein